MRTIRIYGSKNPSYKRNTKSDIYSYGVILWDISNDHKPFPKLTKIQIAIKIFTNERGKPVEGTSPEYVELYKRCWDDDPNNRPKIGEILDFFLFTHGRYCNELKI